jgi:serine/threonine protein kinase
LQFVNAHKSLKYSEKPFVSSFIVINKRSLRLIRLGLALAMAFYPLWAEWGFAAPVQFGSGGGPPIRSHRQPESLRPGHQVSIIDESQTEITYRVVSRLGQGGMKTSYLIEQISPPCVQNCRQVLGIYQDQLGTVMRRETVLHPHIENFRSSRRSPFIRREQSAVTATTHVDLPEHARGREIVSLSDYYPEVASHFNWLRDGDLRTLDILGEQLYSAIQEMHEQRLVHLDIKP